MKKDIPIEKVENVAMAVVEETNNLGGVEWVVYLINLQNKPLETALISSKGYGVKDNVKVTTSALRHSFGDIPANSYAKVELIQEEVFGLSNEYWLSFYQNGQIFDKKYTFVPNSINRDYFTEIPLLGINGVMIK